MEADQSLLKTWFKIYKYPGLIPATLFFICFKCIFQRVLFLFYALSCIIQMIFFMIWYRINVD